jgi:2-methylcitrate dehydratase PrpD
LDVLKGEVGLGAATGAPSTWTSSRRDGGRPRAVSRITVEPYPCCGHAFAAIYAALALREAGVEASSVRRIAVSSYRTALEAAGVRCPRTVAEARFSLPFTVAVALRDGHLVEGSFSVESLADERLTSLMAAVELVVDEEF